ncbi:MAG: nitroreductase family protein [Thermosphaera sp.]
MDRDELIQFILTRRSVRRYRPEPVPLEMLTKILDIARYAPSARNKQPWSFILITDHEVKSRIASVYAWRQPISEAPAGVVVACDSKESPTSYVQDCVAASMYIMFAAHAMGLGTCWHGLLSDEVRKRVQEILKLPSEKIPVVLLSIGWPDESPEPKPRKPLREVGFLNAFGNPIEHQT